MAKRHKTTAAEQDEMLATPAGSATEPPQRQDWPEATESRELGVELSDEEAHAVALTLIDQMHKVGSLDRQKKATAKDYDKLISEAETEIERLSSIVQSKQDRREIPCRWEFQCNGRDAEGVIVYHSDLKTLFREDTGEQVEIKPITQTDRQMILPLDAEETKEANLAKLKAAGKTLEETPADSDHESSFVMIDDETQEQTAVFADSYAEAAAAAVALLPVEEAA